VKIFVPVAEHALTGPSWGLKGRVITDEVRLFQSKGRSKLIEEQLSTEMDPTKKKINNLSFCDSVFA
jgi:hypothetical protein